FTGVLSAVGVLAELPSVELEFVRTKDRKRGPSPSDSS
ncbi:MAG: hypothetical protein ACI9HK_001520, partial [Pirellulaceae bacterium]